MSGIEQAANDLFFKLRNRFPNINMGDDDGNTTSNPQESKFFNFDYEEGGIKFGNITASLIDGQNLKLYFSHDVTQYMDRAEKQAWYKFLQEIRKFAKSHMLGLDIRDIAKDALSQKDLQFVSNQMKEKTLGESRVLWSRKGKVSEGDLNNVKIHVVHSERMDENPHNRLLRVDRIFLVNESGERFLLPFKNVMGAKAMATHVGRGGNPYDTSGRLISNAINEMTNLRRFAGITRRKTFESEDASKVIEAAQAIKESIQRSLFRLANNRRFDENMEDLSKLLAEQDDVEDIKPFFTQTVYNENLDNWISSAAKAFKQYKGNIMENLIENASTVVQKLSSPQWRLVLKDEPAEDRIISTSRYTDGRALLRRILGTIADRASMDDSDVANWASQIGNDMEMGSASQQDMQIALQLAKRYQDDLRQIAANPEYAKEVRVAAFGQKKDLYGKVKDESAEFESFVNGIGEEGPEIQQDKLPPMSAMDRINQKLGTGSFAPQKPTPINTAPLPGSPGPGPEDKAALTRMIDNESAEGGETAMDRISARVAAREGETTPMERVSERVAARNSADTVNEKSETNEAFDDMMWLAGLKKKSEVSEADPAGDIVDFMRQQNRLPDTPYFGGGKTDTGVAPSVSPATADTSTPSNAPRVSPATADPVGPSNAPRVGPATADPVGPSNAPRVGPATADPVGPTGYSPKVYSTPSSVPSPSSLGTWGQNFADIAKSKPGIGAITGGAFAIPSAINKASQGDYKGAAGEIGKGAGKGAALGALAMVPGVGAPAALGLGALDATTSPMGNGELPVNSPAAQRSREIADRNTRTIQPVQFNKDMLKTDGEIDFIKSGANSFGFNPAGPMTTSGNWSSGKGAAPATPTNSTALDPTTIAQQGMYGIKSVPKGFANPERQITQPGNMKPVQYSPDMTTPDRLKDLAGIGRK